MSKPSDICWYPMYCAYCSELKVKEELDKLHIDNYLPMEYQFVEHGGERRRELVPVVLLFWLDGPTPELRSRIDALMSTWSPDALTPEDRYVQSLYHAITTPLG